MRAALAFALACGGGGGLAACTGVRAPAPPPAALAYRLPSPPVAGYRITDTVRVELQAMGQSFAVEGGARSEWRMEYATDPAGLRVTATLLGLDARMSNPLGPGQTVDESQVSGPVVFVLDPRGEPTMVSVPPFGGAAQFFTGSTIAHGFFPRLPGRAPAAGEGWVDTVSYAATEAGTQTTVRTVWSFTAAGDSSIAGAPYQLVRASGETEQSSSGGVGGAEFTQRVTGVVHGHFLWDVRAGLLHSSQYESDLSGHTELSIAPAPLEVRVRSTVRVMRTPLP